MSTYKTPRDNLHKTAWKHLKLLSTTVGVQYRLIQTNRNLDYILERCKTISILINASRQLYEDYLASHSIISLYYMLFKLIQALIVSFSPRVYDLKGLQNSSKYGHGIKMDLKVNQHFPLGIRFWYTENGMLSDLIKDSELKGNFVKESSNKINQLLQKENNLELTKYNIFSAKDLLVRIPELNLYLYELNCGKPLYFRTSQGAKVHTNDPGADISFDDEEWKFYNTQTIEKFIRQFNRPKAPYNEKSNNEIKFSPPIEDVFHYDVHFETPLYSYWIVKLNKIDDMLVIYFSLLYIFSILIRYYPAEWERMTVGECSIYPLIDTFTELCLIGIPFWVCNKIYGREVIF